MRTPAVGERPGHREVARAPRPFPQRRKPPRAEVDRVEDQHVVRHAARAALEVMALGVERRWRPWLQLAKPVELNGDEAGALGNRAARLAYLIGEEHSGSFLHCAGCRPSSPASRSRSAMAPPSRSAGWTSMSSAASCSACLARTGLGS